LHLKTLLFDLDGTLINSLPLIRRSFEYTFRLMGIPWGDGAVLKTVGLPLADVAEDYAPGRAREFLKHYGDYQLQHQDELLHAYPGTADTLYALQQAGYPLGVVTSKRRPSALTGLRLTGLLPYFASIVTVEDTAGKPKPNPEPVLKALEIFGIGPEEAVFIGDSWYDIMTGKNAGVTTIGVTWGMATREELNQRLPDFLVDDWSELLMTLRGL
jgi:pyrophosphatase PpaX